MADDPTPTTARRQVGARLRELRQARGLTAAEVMRALGFSVSKVSRMESGARAVSEEDLALLIDYYEVDESAAREIEETARAGRRRRDPWVSVATTTTEGNFQQFVASGFVELERDAEVVRDFNASVVPGLLQTEEYMRAMMVAAAPVEEDLRERAIRQRLTRQRRLDRPGRYAAVLDEAVLLREIGGSFVMAEQLNALLERCRAGAVDLRVVPLSAGYHPGLNSSFTILSMERDLVFVEGVVGFQTYDGDDVVTRVGRVWEQLRACAASPAETKGIIEAVRDRYRDR